MTDHRAARQAALREQLDRRGVTALLVTHLPNIRWLTGFTGSAGIAVALPDRVVLITDFRYGVQAPQEAGAAAEVMIERQSVWSRVQRLLADSDPAQVGYEAQVLSARDVERLGTMVGATVIPTSDLIEGLRQVKDADEVTAIRTAATLALEALTEVLPTVRVGERELDIAARLEMALRVRGSEWHPFETIVASGPRSALPHARTSTRELKRGEFLLLDFGARVDGYCADVTRTVTLGPADERQRTVYELVREAQQRAREQLRGGMTGREADTLAREVIAARGFGDAFGHSLGHGLGLEVHEAPRLAATAEARVPTGAVVTVEPGIYLPGWGGVRLEDDVWLSADGPVLLSDGRTDLVELHA